MNFEAKAAGVAGGGESNADENQKGEMVRIVDNSKGQTGILNDYNKEHTTDGTDESLPDSSQKPEEMRGKIMCTIVNQEEKSSEQEISDSGQRPDHISVDGGRPLPDTLPKYTQKGDTPVSSFGAPIQSNAPEQDSYKFDPTKAEKSVDEFLASHDRQMIMPPAPAAVPQMYSTFGAQLSHHGQQMITPFVPVPAPQMPTLWTPYSESFRNGLQGYGNSPINATVDIVSIVKCESDADSFYRCQVCCSGKIHTKDIPIKDFVSGKWLWSIPGLFSTAKSMAETSKQLFCYLNSKVSQGGFQTEYLFDRPGWRDIERKHLYGTPAGAIGCNMIPAARSKTGQRIQVEPGQHVGNVKAFLSVVQLTPDKWTAALIALYDVLSFMWPVFDDAGCTPEFILLLCGPSGSCKTSIALATTQTEYTKAPKFQLSSTASALADGYMESRHAVLLVDDLTPSTLKRDLPKVEELLRSFGNSTAKQLSSRYTGGKQRNAEGGCIITAELNPIEAESSRARILELPQTQEDVDTDVLTNLQNTPWLASFMYGFIRYISGKYDEAVKLLKERSIVYYSSTTANAHPRFKKCRLCLLSAKDLLLWFGSATGQLTQEECDQWDERLTRCITSAIGYNAMRYKSQSLSELICSAITDAMETGYLKVVPYDGSAGRGDRTVLESESTIYIRLKDIFSAFEKYTKDLGIKADYKGPTLAKALIKANIAQQSYEGCQLRSGKKLPGSNARYVEINRKELYDNADYESAE